MKNKCLIVYYSHSGNTRKLAHLIAKLTGGDIAEIIPEVAYPTLYDEVTAQAKIEIQRHYHPLIQPMNIDIASFDTIMIGTPNWWSTMAPPVASFLTTYDVAGKRIVPFCTHGSGGFGHMVQDMKKLCPDAVIEQGFEAYGNSFTAASIITMLNRLDIELVT